MKNQMTIIPLLVSCIIFSAFIFTGINVIAKYFGNKANWHFITALIGTIVSIFLLIVSLAGFAIVIKSNKQKNLPYKS
jgi:poly-D-alanine transfer protein DltD